MNARAAAARLALAALVLAVLAGCSSHNGTMPITRVTLGIEWQPVGAAPALAPRPIPALDCFGVGDPALARLADGTLAMWYSAGGTSGGPFVTRATLDGAFGVTRSPDAALIPPGADGLWDRFVETVSAWPDSASGHVRMAYLGYADTGFVAPAIGVTVSGDSVGTLWTRAPAPVYRPSPGAWDGALVTGPSLMRGSDGLWRIYYSGAGTTIGIGLLTSPDGVTWTPYPGNPVFERRLGQWDEATLEPCVREFNGCWYLWYSGYREPLADSTTIDIGLAISYDGIHWMREHEGPVLAHGAAGAWASHRVLAPDVIRLGDGSLLMAAYGQTRADVGVVSGKIGFWRSK